MGSLSIRWIGQNGYLLRDGNNEICIDPYLSNVVDRVAKRGRMVKAPFAPEKLKSDVTVCTHDHLDHLDPETVSRMKKDRLFVTTSEGKERLLGLGRENVAVLCEGESIRLGDFEITAVFADHTVQAFGVIVKAEGKTLYFSGDTLYHEKLFEIGAYAPDVTFICINGRLGNMNVEEALTVAKKIGARINVPTHYDMFASNSEDPHLFADHIDGGMILEFNKEYRF